MPVMRVAFTSRKMQRVAGVRLDDIIINRLPTCNIISWVLVVLRHNQVCSVVASMGTEAAEATMASAAVVTMVTLAGLALVAVGGKQGNNARLFCTIEIPPPCFL